MFELSVALKYLIPRWRQLSVTIISLISVTVIALVVWLIVVFFSVTYGLEKTWVQKLIALTAPVRITPTEKYYNSYYYNVDSVSDSSDYTLKSIREKLNSPVTNPYNPEIDEEIPHDWVTPDINADGTLKDPVKQAFRAIDGIRGIKATDFEMTISNLRLRLLRKQPGLEGQYSQSFITQMTYLGSYDSHNKSLPKTILPPSQEDMENIVAMELPKQPFQKGSSLPSLQEFGDGILLPKNFKEVGVRIGDRGHLTYYTPTPSTVQEQRVPVFVAGFYDPGIFPMGGKFVIANPEVTTIIRSSHHSNDNLLSNGINIRFDDTERADNVKEALLKAFKEEGIDNYWHIETFREFEFTKDLLQQLRSEKNLFSLISMVIIIVACSNIISMLIILVNDKKLEIGILRSMGATSRSIATIFGFCGFVMGVLGSLLGTVAAVITLHNLESLVNLISRLQGFDAFNPVFYGETLPNEVSFETLAFVIITTAVISVIAGIVPAVKASLLRPSTILRSE